MSLLLGRISLRRESNVPLPRRAIVQPKSLFRFQVKQGMQFTSKNLNLCILNNGTSIRTFSLSSKRVGQN
jgi:hypothetical protein